MGSRFSPNLSVVAYLGGPPLLVRPKSQKTINNITTLSFTHVFLPDALGQCGCKYFADQVSGCKQKIGVFGPSNLNGFKLTAGGKHLIEECATLHPFLDQQLEDFNRVDLSIKTSVAESASLNPSKLSLSQLAWIGLEPLRVSLLQSQEVKSHQSKARLSCSKALNVNKTNIGICPTEA